MMADTGRYVAPSAANNWVGRTSEEAGQGAGYVWDGSQWVAAPTNRITDPGWAPPAPGARGGGVGITDPGYAPPPPSSRFAPPSADNNWAGRRSEDAGQAAGQMWNGTAWVAAPTVGITDPGYVPGGPTRPMVGITDPGYAPPAPGAKGPAYQINDPGYSAPASSSRYVLPSADNNWAGRTSAEAGQAAGQVWDGTQWVAEPTMGIGDFEQRQIDRFSQERRPGMPAPVVPAPQNADPSMVSASSTPGGPTRPMAPDTEQTVGIGSFEQQQTANAAQDKAQQHQIGQTGIPFGGGQFTWGQHPDGTWGWASPDGRRYDAAGNPVQATQAPAAPAPAQPTVTAQAAAPAAAAGAAPGAPLPNQGTADNFLSFLQRTPPTKINTYGFNKLKQSTQDFTLAGYEALGYDKNDAAQDIQNLLPKATGPRRGYVAPMG